MDYTRLFDYEVIDVLYQMLGLIEVAQEDIAMDFPDEASDRLRQATVLIGDLIENFEGEM